MLPSFNLPNLNVITAKAIQMKLNRNYSFKICIICNDYFFKKLIIKRWYLVDFQNMGLM